MCFNDGVLGKVRVLEELCGKAGSNSVVGLKRLDLTRVRKAEMSFKEVEKRARKAKKTTKRRLEDVENEEDPSYGAGLF